MAAIAGWVPSVPVRGDAEPVRREALRAWATRIAKPNRRFA